MRIVIDMQGAQTESRFRGIGRYSRSFVQALVREAREHEVVLALNEAFPETIEPIRAAFEGLVPQDNIQVFSIPRPVRESDVGTERHRSVGEMIREAFLASFKPDLIHVTSFFEGYVDDAVTSIGHFAANTPVSVSLYDLIPLVNRERYLDPNPVYAKYYERKIVSLRRASLYLAISEFARQEALVLLDREESQVVNVSSAIEDHFRVLTIPGKEAAEFLARFRLERPFVLYAGGVDERKNLSRLLEAFSALPVPLRNGHDLVLAGKLSGSDVERLRELAGRVGLSADHLKFTGYVSDEELVQLYNLCKVFIFPSWHEGFGLPPLEAMACGAVVIGAGTSSIPEVIGLKSALFDPFDVSSISRKLAEALGDQDFRTALRRHGIERAKRFSWDETARRAWVAFESLKRSEPMSHDSATADVGRKRLAFVSPMPPERTGIADYAAELLPALSRHYDIDVVVAKDVVAADWGKDSKAIRDIRWFREHSQDYDRVLYQVGNSPFHAHILPLITEIPGTVVLHDFFLSGLAWWRETVADERDAWVQALFLSHGYPAVRDRFKDPERAKQLYPANLPVIQRAQGVIVHSEFSKALACEWYGGLLGQEWRVIPLLRKPADCLARSKARAALGFKDDDFVVCSFGFLDPTKCNERLLSAWIKSDLSVNSKCLLVFVGENHGGQYGLDLANMIDQSGCGERVRITGFASRELFQTYLSSADLAVQLRASSRGETSATALDCMNFGVPLIVNGHGAMAELDHESVWMLGDTFEERALIDALETLWRDPSRRRAMSQRGQKSIRSLNAPEHCATLYEEAIEHFYSQVSSSVDSLVESVARLPADSDDPIYEEAAKAIASTFPVFQATKRLLVDVTGTSATDRRTGIERVARARGLALIEDPPPGYRIEPVRLSNDTGEWAYRFARRFALDLLRCPANVLADDLVEPECGDVLLGVDLSGDSLVQAERSGLITAYRNRGVRTYFIVYDLLPVRMPEVFPPGADRAHREWLLSVAKSDGALCISKTVADELASWLDGNAPSDGSRRKFRIGSFTLGADFVNSSPTTGLPTDAESTLQTLRRRPTFLMVGTIEPRKAYLQSMEAFTQLWNEGVDFNLVIVGAVGWRDLPEDQCRDIPETVRLLEQHPERSRRLFWLQGVSDEFLARIYSSSTCLLAASYGEGFGLPIVEAVSHGIPVLARDLPVFREVACEDAQFFEAENANALASAVKAWLKGRSQSRSSGAGRQPLTWQRSASLLARVLSDWGNLAGVESRGRSNAAGQ
jgi:glycosyltransferase involved in cell wall biosynthesis